MATEYSVVFEFLITFPVFLMKLAVDLFWILASDGIEPHVDLDLYRVSGRLSYSWRRRIPFQSMRQVSRQPG